MSVVRLWRRSISHVLGSGHHAELRTTIFNFCKLGKLKEALKALYSEKLVYLDLSIYSTVLQLCINLKANREGRSVHSHLMANGYQKNMHLDTKFIIFYSKIGDVHTARNVFDEMHDRSIVSWSAMISGYTQNGFLQEALATFVLMRWMDAESNQFTYGSILKACTGLGCIEGGKQVHGSVVKNGFVVNLFVQSALIDLHLKCGSGEDARYLFEKMAYRDVVTWNAVIGGHAVRGLGGDAIALFSSMLSDGMLPDHFTFGSVLKACCRDRSLVKVNQIHGIIVRLGFEDNHIVIGSLIDTYAKCRRMSSARLVYDSMPDKDLISCTAVITGYAQVGCCSGDALELFSKINQMGMEIDDVVMCSIINICANTALESFGRQVHARAFKSLPYFDIAMNNALVDMYAKSGDIEDARRAFDDMQSRNVISWTSMISGYGKHGFALDAILLFDRMEDDGFKPNDVTFLSLLSACSHAGLTNKGWQCFNSMVSNYGIQPRAEHYSCVVDLFARGGQLEDAYNIVCNHDLEFNASLWGALLGACRVHGNVILGEVSANILFCLEPENSVNYVVLANIYAAAGLWEDAWKTRKLMEAKSTKKIPGYSFIQFPKKRTPLFLETYEYPTLYNHFNKENFSNQKCAQHAYNQV